MFVPGRKKLIRAILLMSIILIINSASCSVYPFGSKVLLDHLDIGKPLYRLPAGTTIAFWDIGTPGYDVDDPVYLHISYSTSCTTNANDVRLSSLGNFLPGTKVRFNESDMSQPLTRLPSIICFLNENGSQKYDLNDPVYLHQITNCGNSNLCDHSCCHYPGNSKDMMTGFFERLPYKGEERPSLGLSYALFRDNYKLFISDKLIDKKPRKVGEMQGLCIEMIQGLEADYYHVLGTWLIKIQAHEKEDECHQRDGKCDGKYDAESSCCRIEELRDEFIQTNDIILSSMLTSVENGTKVTNGMNKDLVSLPPLASFLGENDAANVGFFDANGNGIYDYEDDVYLNVPAGISKGIVTVNNVRLSGQI